MSAELPEGAVRSQPMGSDPEGKLRGRGRAAVLLAFAAISSVFALMTELVLHRWLRLYSRDITGAAWLFFGGYWSVAAARRLRPASLLSEPLPPQPSNRILAAYRATLPRVASGAIAVMAVAGVVQRLRR